MPRAAYCCRFSPGTPSGRYSSRSSSARATTDSAKGISRPCSSPSSSIKSAAASFSSPAGRRRVLNFAGAPISNAVTVISTNRGLVMRRLLAAATLAATVTFAAGLASPAFSAGDPSVDQIYAAARSGHLDQAQQMISQVLADHPQSGQAHYVQAELFARQGKAALARSELAAAEQLKPGLPFANPRSVQELKAELGLGGG